MAPKIRTNRIEKTIREVTWLLNEKHLSFQELFDVLSAAMGTFIYNNLSRSHGDALVNVLSEGLKKGGKKIEQDKKSSPRKE